MIWVQLFGLFVTALGISIGLYRFISYFSEKSAKKEQLKVKPLASINTKNKS